MKSGLASVHQHCRFFSLSDQIVNDLRIQCHIFITQEKKPEAKDFFRSFLRTENDTRGPRGDSHGWLVPASGEMIGGFLDL